MNKELQILIDWVKANPMSHSRDMRVHFTKIGYIKYFHSGTLYNRLKKLVDMGYLDLEVRYHCFPRVKKCSHYYPKSMIDENKVLKQTLRDKVEVVVVE